MERRHDNVLPVPRQRLDDDDAGKYTIPPSGHKLHTDKRWSATRVFNPTPKIELQLWQLIDDGYRTPLHRPSLLLEV